MLNKFLFQRICSKIFPFDNCFFLKPSVIYFIPVSEGQCSPPLRAWEGEGQPPQVRLWDPALAPASRGQLFAGRTWREFGVRARCLRPRASCSAFLQF